MSIAKIILDKHCEACNSYNCPFCDSYSEDSEYIINHIKFVHIDKKNIEHLESVEVEVKNGRKKKSKVNN